MRRGFLENGETKERRRLPKKEIRVSREEEGGFGFFFFLKKKKVWGESFVRVKASMIFCIFIIEIQCEYLLMPKLFFLVTV